MLEKLWSSLNDSPEVSNHAEIFAWTYWNYPGDRIKDIREQFDQWSIEDFEAALDLLQGLPHLEGESIETTMFGDVEWKTRIDYFEGNNLTILPEFFWFVVSNPRKKSKFF